MTNSPEAGRPPGHDVRIDEIEASDRVLAKVAGRRNVTWDDIADACAGRPSMRWSFDADRGWRLLVQGRLVDGRLLKVVLYPVDGRAGAWRLGTAMWATRPL